MHSLHYIHVCVCVCTYVCLQKDNTPLAGKENPHILWNSKVPSYSKDTEGGSYSRPNDNSPYLRNSFLHNLHEYYTQSTLRSLQVLSSLWLLFCSPHACYITRHLLLD